MPKKKTGEYIIEFHQVGNQVKVTAIDPVSFREVSIIGALNVRKEDLSALAVRKLKYVLNKAEEE